ncbi:hypothetical protein M2137_002411 [Parabacteroides sp. PFB2-10]|uniref:type IX secretion system protein PorD n=1 Tax=Parabacteroides sp. PFB2-10 TaxID=1742405 RepID=UPI0024753BE7|nr:DUF4835 family protein [Parabacteroides sp. PFB2-10]MDH6313621.1 hypothetical protein [Parabacteroides sp. PFB2-10]MDL2244491.1 DUF4835 family protein [Parabacteroides sp. OttesenSCG-928-J18]
MKQMNKMIGILLACMLSVGLQAQELNARITINSDKIQGTNKQVFTTLQTALTEFVNNKKWTDATFTVNERIDCTMTIIVNEQADNSFKSELQIQARRPVYNSSYTTTILNISDRAFDFEYAEFEPLEYAENMLSSNLTATMVFYIYLILGLDFDSFSPQGGSPFLQQAQQVVSLAQAQVSWTGWKAFENDQNRHAIITALTDNTSEAFREMWYTYHRRGLDEMAANADRGRANIIAALPGLQQVKSARPTSVILQMFVNAKLDEVVAIYSKATSQEKQEGYKMLSDLFPAEQMRLEPLTQP